MMPEEKEKLVRFTVYLEEEMLKALEEFAEKYTEETGKKWTKGAVVRLALSEFFARQGKII
jgi:hypothetical protein